MKLNINVLSLFDGISCARIAIEKSGMDVDKYYISEVDKYAKMVSQHHYPDSINLGDVEKWREWDIDFSSIDVLIGGSPCTQLSRVGNGDGLQGKDSRLFFAFVDIWNYIKSKNRSAIVLLENVKMKKEWVDEMSHHMELQPVLINSSLVSAQNRERFYWTNIEVKQPKDRNIFLRDIVFPDVYPVVLHNLYGGYKEKHPRVFEDKSPTIRTSKGGGHIPSFVKSDWIHSQKALSYMDRQIKDGRNHWDFLHHSDVRNPKSSAIVANLFKGVPYNVLKDWDCIRKFHPQECERLQTIPDGWTSIPGVSNTQRYKMIGNAFTVDVISHILEGLSSS